MSVTSDLDFLLQAERQAREQAEASNSDAARVAHLLRADEYASKAAALKGKAANDR